jgi:hypothetical protein
VEVGAEAVIIRIDKAKVALIVFGGLIFVGGGVWLCIMPDGLSTKPLWYLRVIGGICVIFFGLCTLSAIQRLFTRKPALVVDRDGIIDHTSVLCIGRIRWQDIEGIRLDSMQGIRFAVVDVRDPRQFVERGNILQRWVKAINMRIVGSPVSLMLSRLDEPPEVVMTTIGRYFDRATGRRVSPPA